MAKRIYISINPAILKWARKSLHLSLEDVAEHFTKKSKQSFKIDLSAIRDMESSTEQISIPFTLLKEFSAFYKRPLALFLIEQPPQNDPLPADRRTINSNTHRNLSRSAMLVIRRVRRIQDATREIFELLNIKYELQFKQYSVEHDPNKLAAMVRNKFGFSVQEQKKCKQEKDLFDLLRNYIEKFGAITLKDSFPVEDARAFSIVDRKPYIIVINNKDTPGSFAPKIFSLMHEFAHILIRDGAICNDFISSHIQVEKFCNQFAASFLVPKDIFQSTIAESKKKDLLELVDELKKIFKVSKYVLLRRMLTFKHITPELYEQTVREWEQQYKQAQENKKEDDFVPHLTQYRKAFNNRGQFFTGLVFEAQRNEKITYDAAADYLGIKVKHMTDLEHLLISNA